MSPWLWCLLHRAVHFHAHSRHARRQASGVRCIHLTAHQLCALFGMPERPAVCSAFRADPEVCGDSPDAAIRLLGWLEEATSGEPAVAC